MPELPVPDEAVELAHAKSVTKFTIGVTREMVEAAAPAIRNQERQRIREALLDAMEKARQAHVKPNGIEGDLFGDLHDKDFKKANAAERRMLDGVQVVALADFNAALDRAVPLDSPEDSDG